MAFHKRGAGMPTVPNAMRPDHQRSDSRIVPLPPTAHRCWPSLVPKIE